MMSNKVEYGVWNFEDRCFEDDIRFTYDQAMSFALFCVEEDERFGAKNYAVIKMDANSYPIWHEMKWCGQFQGYSGLYDICMDLGLIIEADDDEFPDQSLC